MFDLKENTTEKLYQFIIKNNLQDIVTHHVNTYNDIADFDYFEDMKFHSFETLFIWHATPEKADYWMSVELEFEKYVKDNKFKFLK